jgi:hypothetical protein
LKLACSEVEINVRPLTSSGQKHTIRSKIHSKPSNKSHPFGFCGIGKIVATMHMFHAPTCGTGAVGMHTLFHLLAIRVIIGTFMVGSLPTSADAIITIFTFYSKLINLMRGGQELLTLH